MVNYSLTGKRVAFLATDGVEQSELEQPWDAVLSAGGKPELISLESGSIQAMHHDKPGDEFPVDVTIEDVASSRYDGLVLPGGVLNPDTLRMNDDCVALVRDFFNQGKPVAAICHGPWLLVEADVVKDRRVTSWPSLRTDLLNAGARWVNAECVCDEGLVTSRNPDDLPAFCAKLVEEVSEGHHASQHA
ncbi:MAG: type 1 glutamine amidotransferase [Planctomycetales bacterium]|nr:type 1 glutamine amidotransferase [Planctomycetales bacterium]